MNIWAVFKVNILNHLQTKNKKGYFMKKSRAEIMGRYKRYIYFLLKKMNLCDVYNIYINTTQDSQRGAMIRIICRRLLKLHLIEKKGV